jgi:hypothetical protein
MAEQRIMGSSVTPQTLRATEITQQNQIAKQQADIERAKMATQQAMASMQTQSRADDRAAEMHTAKMGEMGANERQRMQQEGWDKQREQETLMQKERLGADKERTLLEARIANIKAGWGVNLNTQLKKGEMQSYQMGREQPFPLNGSREEQGSWTKNMLDWRHEYNQKVGAMMDTHALQMSRIGQEDKKVRKGIIRNLNTRQQQIMSLNNATTTMNDHYGRITSGISGDMPRMMQVLTNIDKEKRGWFGELWQMFENTGAGSLIPVSNDILIRPGQRVEQLPWYDEIFGSGEGRGMNFANDPELAASIKGLITESRGNQTQEVMNLLGKQGISPDAIQEVMAGRNIPSYNEYNFGQNTGNADLSEQQFNEAISIYVKTLMGEEVSDKEQANLRVMESHVEGASWNPLVDPETLQGMASGGSDFAKEAFRGGGKSIRTFSSNPIWGGVIASSAVDGNTATIRYAQHIANELESTGQLGGVGDALMPVVMTIMDYIEGGQNNPEALKEKLFNFTLGEGIDPKVFMLIDNIMDNWGVQDESNTTASFVQQLEDTGYDMDGKLFEGIRVAHNQMNDVRGSISGIWNLLTGASSMNSRNDKFVLQGAQNNSLGELVDMVMKDGGTSRQRYIQTGDPEGIGRMETFVDRNQDALDLIWKDLDGPTWAHLPTEFKEAMFRDLEGTMIELDATAYQSEVAKGEESLSGVNQFFTEMSGTETDMLKGQVDIDVRRGQEDRAALEAALADYEN